MKLIEINQQKINQLCIEHSVKKLFLFGSILTAKFNDKSDIDMLIQFSNVDLIHYFDNYMDFKEKVEQLFDRQIDLVEYQAIKIPFSVKS